MTKAKNDTTFWGFLFFSQDEEGNTVPSIMVTSNHQEAYLKIGGVVYDQMANSRFNAVTHEDKLHIAHDAPERLQSERAICISEAGELINFDDVGDVSDTGHPLLIFRPAPLDTMIRHIEFPSTGAFANQLSLLLFSRDDYFILSRSPANFGEDTKRMTVQEMKKKFNKRWRDNNFRPKDPPRNLDEMVSVFQKRMPSMKVFETIRIENRDPAL